MNNGKKRAATKFNKKRTAGTITSASVYSALKKAGYGKPATKAYGTTAQRLIRREIKYDDDYINMSSWTMSGRVETPADAGGGFVNYVLGGVIKQVGSTVGIQPATGQPGMVPGLIYSPNCLTNVDSGTTASTRIGNVIQPRYITLRGVLTACRTNNQSDGETTNNQSALDTEAEGQVRFLRTSVKLYIIRDKSMNEKGFVEYTDVFAPPMQTSSGLAGPAENPFLFMRKIDTIGRYEILKEIEYQLDQDDPQKSFTMIVPLKGKPIRYNGSVSGATSISNGMGSGFSGPWNSGTNISGTVAGTNIGMALKTSSEAQSMTNGIYILAVSHTTVNGEITGKFVSPQLVVSSRLTFED